LDINKLSALYAIESKKEYEQKLEEIKAINAQQSQVRFKALNDTAQEATKRPPYDNRDFYLVLVMTNDPGQDNKPVDRIFVRLSCPTPAYNQVVYKYHHKSSSLEYLWTLPRKAIYESVIANKVYYLTNKATKVLASWCLMLESGKLLEWAKKENGEKPDAIIKTGNDKPVIETIH